MDGESTSAVEGRDRIHSTLSETQVHVPEIERELQHVEAAAELVQQLVETARVRFAGVLDENSDRASGLAALARVSPTTHVGGRLSEVGIRLHNATDRLNELIERCAL